MKTLLWLAAFLFLLGSLQVVVVAKTIFHEIIAIQIFNFAGMLFLTGLIISKIDVSKK